MAMESSVLLAVPGLLGARSVDEEPLWQGHLAYPEAPPEDLVLLPNEKRMHIDAARAFPEMAHAASRDG